MKYLHIVLSLGLSLVIKRIPPRYRYLLIGVIVINEVRGLVVAYAGFSHLFRSI
jgi:hypothetical protein